MSSMIASIRGRCASTPRRICLQKSDGSPSSSLYLSDLALVEDVKSLVAGFASFEHAAASSPPAA
jgi:hypothetical protein